MNGDGQDDDTAFALYLAKAFQDQSVINQLQMALRPVIAPLEDALKQANDINQSLRRQIAERDVVILKLSKRVDELEVKNDDIEQQGRKGSIQIFGLPEEGQSTLEQKILKLCKDNLKLVNPPIAPDDIEVCHRIGRPPAQTQPQGDAEASAADGQPPTRPAVRPVIIKLSNRRNKGRIMDNRKKLKDNPYQLPDGSEVPIYIRDDLTKRRANLAFEARNSNALIIYRTHG